MNFLDIVLICILGIFTIRGFFRGLVREILSLAAIVLAVVLAANYQHLISPHIELYVSNAMTVSVLSYVSIFFGTIIVFWLLARFIRAMLDITLLGWVDRLAGGVFGLIEGMLIGLIALMFLQTFMPKSELLTQSYLAPRAQHMVELLAEYAPESMREGLKSRGYELPTAQEILDSAKQAVGLDEEQPQE